MKFSIRQSLLVFFLLVPGLVAPAMSSASDLYENSSAYARANGNGAVASVHPLATRAGLKVLAAGGNAVDAAVAVALTLGVVDGHNSGIGGGCFAIVRFSDGTIQALDGREMAPAAAHRDMYLRDGKADSSLSTVGPLAVGIPGSLAVYDYLLQKAGTRSLSSLLLPAADIAERGFELSRASHRRIKLEAPKIRRFPASAAILLDENGKPWPAGHTFVQKDLAHTYRRIAEKGVDYFYRGAFARAVDQWMRDNGGLVRYEDFSGYRMKQRQPVETHYRDYRIVGFPPPSSGGVHVGQILNILQHFDLVDLTVADRYHVLAEAMKRAFADRAYYLGDPDFVPVPRGLLDVGYAGELAKTISLSEAASSVEHGNPPNPETDLFGKHTTHIATADKWGNWVAITTTVNTSFGSKVIVPGTGVILNNQMDDFSIQPGVPNAYGLVGNEANSIQPGKRPLSSMSPTLVFRGEQPLMSLGAAGGPTIITQVVQALVNVIDLGMPVADALAAPRIHHQWKPSVTYVENSLPRSVMSALEERGHELYIRPYAGTTQMIRFAGDGFEAATEPRLIELNRH